MRKIIAVILVLTTLFLCDRFFTSNPEYEATIHYDISYRHGTEYPFTQVLHSVAERDSHCTSTLLQNLLSPYDETYFEDRILILVYATTNYMGDLYAVRVTKESDGRLTVAFHKTRSGMLCAIGHMLAVIEVDRSWDADPSRIDVKYI